MKLQISLNYICDNELITALLYFLPDKKYEIDLLISRCLSGDLILLNNNTIIKQNILDLKIKCISSKDFINAVKLLKKCDENTIILKINNITEIKQFGQFGFNVCTNINTWVNIKELKYIKINNEIYELYDNIYTALFKQFKLIDINSYIGYMRSLKIYKLI